MLAGEQRGRQLCRELVPMVWFSCGAAASHSAPEVAWPGVLSSLQAAVGCNKAPGAQGCLGRAQAHAGP